MERRLIITNGRRNHRSWLYSAVYTSRLAVFAVLTLLCSFMVQPFHEALAAEDVAPEEDTVVVAESVKEQVDEEPIVESNETDTEAETETVDATDSDSEEITEPVVDDVVVVDESEDQDDSEGIDVDTLEELELDTAVEESEVETENATSSEIIIDEAASTTEEIIGSASTTTDTIESDDDRSDENQDNPADDFEEDTGSDSESTSSDTDNDTNENVASNEVSVEDVSSTTTVEANPIETLVVEAEAIITEENFYQFSKQSCVAVGDGTYHCSETDFAQYDTQSVVYAELGESGNMEIFLKTADDTTRQITDNEYDDTAPYYDPGTLQVVWQRLIDGRYQIILYDITENKESQLTFSRTNNMEPKVSEDGVVWQAWDNNDWEIMYFDGRFTDQVTDNTAQDVAPVIQDNYVLWTVIGRGDQEAKVYSLDSKEIVTISGYDGGLIENPRFVLVYDTKFDNGDIITQGFDPATGISEPIAAQAAPEPVNIPIPDPIGEIRALIQNKSTFEDELNNDLVQGGDTTNSSASSTDGTLDLSSDGGEEAESITVVPEEADPFELTEFDLILTETDIEFTELEELNDLEEITEIIESELAEPENQTASSTQE